jgi:exonuclease III
MAAIVHINIRGLNCDKKNDKVDSICNELDKPQTKILNIQESRVKDSNKCLSLFRDYTNNYHMFCSNASNEDAGSGILLFVKKTEEIISQISIVEGRLLFIRIKNKVTEQEYNIFSFYGKSNANKNYADGLIAAIEKKVTDDYLENILILGDFNFVTSTIDRKSNQFIPADTIYRHNWTDLEIKIQVTDAFRKLHPTKRLYTFFQGGKIPKSRID